MYFVLFCLQLYEYEYITEGLKCVCVGGEGGIISVGAYKRQFKVSSP